MVDVADADADAVGPGSSDEVEDLDLSTFVKTVTLPGVHVNSRDVQAIKEKSPLKRFIVRRKRLRNVLEDPQNEDMRFVLMSDDFKDALENDEEVKNYVASKKLPVVEIPSTLKYSDLSATEVLSRVLPKNVVVPSSFERIGHIAHLNLLEPQLKYRKVIGKVVLDKNPGIRCVVNKVANLCSDYRTPQLELIAGEPDFDAIVHENQLRLKIIYDKVYWNSRLSGERERLCYHIGGGFPLEGGPIASDKLRKEKALELPTGDVGTVLLCDVMCGVGGFGLTLARKGHYALCNDINPVAVDLVKENAQMNKVADRVQTFNLDGKDFIKHVIKDLDVMAGTMELVTLDPRECKRRKKRKTGADVAANDAASESDKPQQRPSERRATIRYDSVHFVMNLPETAVDFLSGFASFTAPSEEPPPERRKRTFEDMTRLRCAYVYCYFFGTSENTEETAKARITAALGYYPDHTTIREVRDVAPNKRMYCAIMCLPLNSGDSVKK